MRHVGLNSRGEDASVRHVPPKFLRTNTPGNPSAEAPAAHPPGRRSAAGPQVRGHEIAPIWTPQVVGVLHSLPTTLRNTLGYWFSGNRPKV